MSPQTSRSREVARPAPTRLNTHTRAGHRRESAYTWSGTCDTSEAKGLTASEVPMTSNKSHAEKSGFTRRWKRSGRSSPKNTMSGLTSPPYLLRLVSSAF